jgi:hypothetical protein
VQAVLSKRMERFGLTLHPEKLDCSTFEDPRGREAKADVDFNILWPKFQQSMATDPRKAGVDPLRL